MGRHARKRHQRQSDFAKRKKADPSGLYIVPDRGWEYITVHPMADENALLDSLGMTPDDCTGVDCYWSAQSDVVFLRVLSRAVAGMDPGLYVSKPSGHLNMTYLFAVVDRDSISRSTLEAVMHHYAQAGVHRMKPRSLPHRGHKRVSGAMIKD